MTSLRGLAVTEVERILLDVPFSPRARPWNELLIGQWRLIELIRVATNDPDVVGWGETILDYCYAPVPDEAVAHVRGRNPAECLSRDDFGPGLQMALYDAVGNALGVPVRSLLPLPQVRDECPISWWNTKMPPAVLAQEARDAVAAGYRTHKFKARPWFDVYEQVDAVSAVTPPDYLLDLDWNEMLRDAATAAPVLSTLERTGRVGIFETPLPHHDLAGYRALRGKLNLPVADHFLDTPFAANVSQEAFDGYVVTWQGVGGLLASGTQAAGVHRPFFLQMCGTGLTTALALQLGAVLSHAVWPHVTAMNTWSEYLLRSPIEIRHGYARVPDGPGLGVRVDEEAVHRLSVPGAAPIRYPRRILTISWPGGRRRSYAGAEQMWTDCRAGNVPAQQPGADLEVRDDDGSSDFADLYRRCALAPVTR
ncbi:mandelate racemase/muconate lactonizing enzyme family protein [Dactylosporangium sp. CA-139066]|uniref:mandelate racemase/muconate lactonizing enzyme family protein n=1 Tax=Dactylosporangium sp. CA-139066 TaxID=3239930 RepID=UPI003D94CF4A